MASAAPRAAFWRLLAALERVVERQPVVADRDRFVGVFERVDRGGVLSCCVPVGAGRAGGVDRALGLIHFLVGRGPAREAKERCGDTRKRTGRPPKHIDRV